MRRRNILLMIADDLGMTAGCYGDASARTPNIDRLAAQGTRFTHAFTSTASCSGSRSVIQTGLHTHQSGQYGLHHGRHHFQTFADVATAPNLLAAAGHATGIVGKVHLGPDSTYPWASRQESDSRDVAWVAARAEAFIAGAGARPFFLTVGFIDPHRDASRAGFGDPAGPDPIFAPEAVTVPPWLADLPEVRHELAAYHHAVARMDRGVGLVLDALDRQGAADETLVVFLSDNGAPFVHSKTTLFDAGVHLPLILRVPGQGAGVANPNLVSFVDLLPTFLDWAGVEPPQDGRRREGRSLLPVLHDRARRSGWDRVFGSHTFHEITNYWPTRFLRDTRYKYHRNVAWQLPFPVSTDIYGSLSFAAIRRAGAGARPLERLVRRPAEELFDLAADPLELHNLAGHAGYGAVLAEMRAALEQWQRRTRDPWLLRDGVSVLAAQDHVAAGLKLPGAWDFTP
ncbi:MAG: sulfatase [Marinovum algicola]|jgi:N-sulfoglucosamine sulfohydrolase|uniref:N-sulfoglucosamine sulfohydrolase n=1 Tax=Marinovum algicola TaxID=42444 RepID=A0A975WCT8_9RHOB|nr:sulfatase [Marinovum algicola]SEJ95476.1 N-sulfoglucosamine sulfohydrolase [Marinovum algicola]SLN68410.1 Arylsulfatase [Marinovum algicola]